MESFRTIRGKTIECNNNRIEQSINVDAIETILIES